MHSIPTYSLPQISASTPIHHDHGNGWSRPCAKPSVVQQVLVASFQIRAATAVGLSDCTIKTCGLQKHTAVTLYIRTPQQSLVAIATKLAPAVFQLSHKYISHHHFTMAWTTISSSFLNWKCTIACRILLLLLWVVLL